MELKKGSLVKAIAGHEKNNFFIVLEFDEKFALIADGKSRKLEKPKKKSLKHLRITNTVIDMNEITDKKLRKWLNECSRFSVTESGGNDFV